MTAAYSVHRPDSVTVALGVHLIVYCAVGAGLAFYLYALLQPSRAPNAGLGAYEPPPGAVVKYRKPPISPVEHSTVPVTLAEPEPATTGRSTPEPEPKPTVAAPPSHPRAANRPNREVRRRVAPCIPGYDSSGAQTRPCG